MKKIIFIIAVITSAIVIQSCKNEKWEFDNFDYSTSYFPYQYPVRTIVLGDYIFDNTNDNNHKFIISPVIGGLYENKKGYSVDFVIDENLAANLIGPDGNPIKVLPSKYYSLNPTGTVPIPVGSMKGNIEVQLTDDFFKDTLSVSTNYVIPLKIMSSTTDSILQGYTLKTNPDRRVASDWTIVPQDFTLFGIKYINPYHGNYLHFGQAKVTNQAGVELEKNVYSEFYMVDNSITKLSTIDLNSVSMTTPIRFSVGGMGNIDLKLTYNENGSITIKEKDGSPVPVTGTGTYVKNGSEWGGEKRNMMVLNYNYSSDFVATPAITQYNDNNTLIKYTGTWVYGAEAACFNGDRSYSNTIGSALELDFTGSEIAIYTKTGAYGTYDVYIDDMTIPIATNVNTTATSTKYKVKTYEKTQLTNGPHKLKCVIKQSKVVAFDYFEVTVPSKYESGKFNWAVTDTLVVRDRAVKIETFQPVLRN